MLYPQPLCRTPEPRATGWLDAAAPETLYLSAVTVTEPRYGVRSLPAR